MEKTVAIIICAGEATRWGNYKDTPKHLIEIEGERLLNRTVRLLIERGVHEIYVAVKKLSKEYHVDDSIQYQVELNYKQNADADKFLSTKDLWNEKGRTIVLYGDCYFTEEAMDTIVLSEIKEWTLFCRPNASSITGTPWGECFAQSFYPEHLKQHEEMLHYVADLYKRGVINRCGGWEHYRAMIGRRDEKVKHPHVMGTNFVEIDDFTDDFDYPKDLENWLERRKLATTQ